MEILTFILSAIAAGASVVSVILVIKNNRQQKRHLKNRLSVLDDVYNGSMSQFSDSPMREEGRIELETLKRDLNP